MTEETGPSGGSRVPRGTRLNGIYEIEALIAEGGMGEVYKAHNIQTGDPVAVKLVRPQFARNEDVLALFRREASLLHTLHHEAIVRYFVFTVEPDLQRAYLAMEFVDGPSLGAVQAKAPLPVDAVRHLQGRLAGGLAVAHARGVVHRDLSPDNVILPGGDVRQARIIDFGIARSTNPDSTTIIGGQFAGKYNYVSPEQLGLFGGTVDARSDIYSLGLLLAGALLGRPLTMNGTPAEVLEKRRAVPDLSGIDPSMRPLLSAMLQPDPADRPQSMLDVAGWTDDRTVVASALPRTAERPAPSTARTGPSRPSVVEPPPSRGKGPAVAIAAAVVAAAIGAGGLGWTLGWWTPGGGPSEATGPSADGAPPPEATDSPTAPQSQDAQIVRPTDPQPPTEGAAGQGAQPAALPDADPGQQLPPAEIADALLETIIGATDPTPADGAATAPDAATDPDAATTAPEGAGQDGTETSPADDIREKILAELARDDGQAPPPPPGGSGSGPRPDAEPAAGPPPADTGSEVARQSDGDPAGPSDRPPRVEGGGPAAAPPAELGRSYVAPLPRFVDPDGGPVSITVDGDLPPGLSVFWKPDGAVQISGIATVAGTYAFGLVARDSGANSIRVPVSVAVIESEGAPIQFVSPDGAEQPAVPPVESPATPAAPGVPAGLTVAGFLADFDGGACFFARPLVADAANAHIEGFGSAVEGFQRLESSFMKDFTAEPRIDVRLVEAGQCPAVAFMDGLGIHRHDAPLIELDTFTVGGAVPLTGRIQGIDRTELVFLLVGNDGSVTRLDSLLKRAGDGATFSIPIQADAGSAGVPQLLMALATDRPLASLPQSGSAEAVFAALAAELSRSGADVTMDAEMFKVGP